MSLNKPILDSYWVKPGQLLVGEYPGHYEVHQARQRLSAFLEAGFTNFIDLTNLNELIPYESILMELARPSNLNAEYTRISIQDGGVPSYETMNRILNTIDDALGKGRKVYVHCWGGVGRTGTVVGCYLVRHGMTGEQALRQIANWWMEVPKHIYHQTTPETEEQAEFIRNWSDSANTEGGVRSEGE
jgi:Swiss Army Knife protein, DSP-PTPase phosphatase domain